MKDGKADPSPPIAALAGFENSADVLARAVRLARALFAPDLAGVTLVGENGLWRSFDPDGRMSRHAPLVEEVVRAGGAYWVEDARRHPRLKTSRSVAPPGNLRFAAAAPIRLETGEMKGILAVASQAPRRRDPELLARLQDVADFIADEWSRSEAKRAREASDSETAN